MSKITSTVSESDAYEALRLAQLNEHNGGRMASSAKLAAEDAAALFNRGEFMLSVGRARASLEYSVGVFHDAWRKVNSLL